MLAAVSLGNMARVVLPPQIQTVILAADNDHKPQAVRGQQSANEAHMSAGRAVREARSGIGKGFNHALTAFKERA